MNNDNRNNNDYYDNNNIDNKTKERKPNISY